MLKLKINGVEVQAEEDWTLLEAIRFYGINIPTICHLDGLTPYGVCRLCVVEIGKGDRAKLVTSCTHPLKEGLEVRTHSNRVTRTRKMLVELLLSKCPSSKILQDLAAKFNIQKVRFEVQHEDCILCGLCVRMCKEQMGSGAIGFVGRGTDRKITTPFDIKSDICRQCGGCIYICPACQLRCQGPEAPGPVCGACQPLQPSCLDYYDDVQCFMSETACGTCVNEKTSKAHFSKRKSKFPIGNIGI